MYLHHGIVIDSFIHSVPWGIIFYKCPWALSKVCSPMLEDVSRVGMQGLTSTGDVHTA